VVSIPVDAFQIDKRYRTIGVEPSQIMNAVLNQQTTIVVIIGGSLTTFLSALALSRFNPTQLRIIVYQSLPSTSFLLQKSTTTDSDQLVAVSQSMYQQLQQIDGLPDEKTLATSCFSSAQKVICANVNLQSEWSTSPDGVIHVSNQKWMDDLRKRCRNRTNIVVYDPILFTSSMLLRLATTFPPTTHLIFTDPLSESQSLWSSPPLSIHHPQQPTEVSPTPPPPPPVLGSSGESSILYWLKWTARLSSTVMVSTPTDSKGKFNSLPFHVKSQNEWTFQAQLTEEQYNSFSQQPGKDIMNQVYQQLGLPDETNWTLVGDNVYVLQETVVGYYPLIQVLGNTVIYLFGDASITSHVFTNGEPLMMIDPLIQFSKWLSAHLNPIHPIPVPDMETQLSRGSFDQLLPAYQLLEHLQHQLLHWARKIRVESAAPQPVQTKQPQSTSDPIQADLTKGEEILASVQRQYNEIQTKLDLTAVSGSNPVPLNMWLSWRTSVEELIKIIMTQLDPILTRTRLSLQGKSGGGGVLNKKRSAGLWKRGGQTETKERLETLQNATSALLEKLKHAEGVIEGGISGEMDKQIQALSPDTWPTPPTTNDMGQLQMYMTDLEQKQSIMKQLLELATAQNKSLKSGGQSAEKRLTRLQKRFKEGQVKTPRGQKQERKERYGGKMDQQMKLVQLYKRLGGAFEPQIAKLNGYLKQIDQQIQSAKQRLSTTTRTPTFHPPLGGDHHHYYEPYPYVQYPYYAPYAVPAPGLSLQIS
jgi:hypothetical protein